jgi:ribA/ribD-fused uncharacterized protein
MISKFAGEYRFLSNFYPSVVLYDGFSYPTVEHAYQAAKTFDENEQYSIRHAKTAAEAKKLGKSLSLRSDWEEVKLSIMAKLLQQKFQDKELAAKLISTGDEELVEGNWWGDTYWGVCKSKGHNYLGKLLMQIRRQLIEAQGF